MAEQTATHKARNAAAKDGVRVTLTVPKPDSGMAVFLAKDAT